MVKTGDGGSRVFLGGVKRQFRVLPYVISLQRQKRYSLCRLAQPALFDGFFSSTFTHKIKKPHIGAFYFVLESACPSSNLFFEKLFAAVTNSNNIALFENLKLCKYAA